MIMSLDAMHFGVHKWWEVVALSYTYISSSHKRVPMHEGIALQDGKGALSVFLHIATKECLCHVYSDLI